MNDYMMQRRIWKWSYINSKQGFLTCSTIHIYIMIYKFHRCFFFPYTVIFLNCQSSCYPLRHISITLRFKLIYCDFNWYNPALSWEMFLLRSATLSNTGSILTYPTAVYRHNEWGGLTQVFKELVNGLLRLFGGKKVRGRPMLSKQLLKKKKEKELRIIIRLYSNINNAEVGLDTVNT